MVSVKPIDPNASPDKIKKIGEKLDKIKEVMTDNIDSVLERGKKLDQLKKTAGALEGEAKLFSEIAPKIKAQARERNFRLGALLFGMLTGGTLSILLGYGVPQMALAIAVGGAIGVMLNRVREWTVDFFSNKITKKYGSVEPLEKEDPDNELLEKLDISNEPQGIYPAYNASRAASGESTPESPSLSPLLLSSQGKFIL